MAFPTTPILDDANRADENPLSQGGNWTTVAEIGGGLRVTGQQIAPAVDFGASYRGSFTNPELYLQLANVPLDVEFNLAVRYTDAGGASPIRDSRRRGYQLTINDFHRYKLHRMDDGASGLELLPWEAFPGGDLNPLGDWLGIQAIDSTIALFLRRGTGAWEQFDETTDGTHAGPGAIMVQGSMTTLRVDNIGGGEAAIATAGAGGRMTLLGVG